MQRTRALRRLTPTILVLNHQYESAIARWIVRVEFGLTPFPQTGNSPQRKIAKAILPPLNYTTMKRAVSARPMKHEASSQCTVECHLDNYEKRCKMTLRDPNPPTAFPQEAEMNTPQETKHESQDSHIFIPW